jgi:hypothetical protein
LSKPFRTVAANAATVTLSDPFFVVLHITTLLCIALLAALPGFTYGEHIRLLRDQVQALLFMMGCLAVTFGLIRTVTDDFRRGAGPVLISRPISSLALVVGKWCGVAMALLILLTTGVLAYLWMSEAAASAEFLNSTSMTMYLLTVTGAVAVAGARHYVARSSFGMEANMTLLVLVVLMFGVRVVAGGYSNFDWIGVQSGVLLGLGVLAFSAVMLPICFMLDSAMVLVMGLVVFFGGLLSSYLIKTVAGVELLSQAIRAVTPNWQVYWVSDRLAAGDGVPISYFGTCTVHALGTFLLFAILASLIVDRMEVPQ